jgi:peptidyl-prolyl cis-trans isomerase A (cyclophilin A)
MTLNRKIDWILAAALFAAPAALLAQAPPTPAAPATATPSAAAPATEREPGLYMTFQTEKGDIACKLFEKESPIAVKVMVGLAVGTLASRDPRTGASVRKRFFDGLTFHRVIPNFMIQGGDPLGNGIGTPGFSFKNENTPGLNFDVPGRLAMANAGPNTNGSQFFITEAPYPSLNGGYTIWGQCGNPDVVKAITHVQTDSNDKPLLPIHIKRVVVERVGPAPANAPEAMPRPTAPAAGRGTGTTSTAPKTTTPKTPTTPGTK